MNTDAVTIEARRLLGVALLSALAVCVIFLVPGLTRGLEYTRTSVGGGELWRMFTCHWTHWTVEHLVWDLAAFVLLLSACLRVNVRQTLLMLAAAIIAIPAGVWFFLPQMMHYRGLSGIDIALFSFLIIHTLKSRKPGSSRIELILVYGLIAGFLLKMSFELITGQTVFVSSMGKNVIGVPLAHLIGAITGCLAGEGDHPCTRAKHGAGQASQDCLPGRPCS